MPENKRTKKKAKKRTMKKAKKEPGMNYAGICQELEACRKLKTQQIEDATKQFPFKGEYVSLKKLDRYIELLQTLGSLYAAEEELLKLLPQREGDGRV